MKTTIEGIGEKRTAATRSTHAKVPLAITVPLRLIVLRCRRLFLVNGKIFVSSYDRGIGKPIYHLLAYHCIFRTIEKPGLCVEVTSTSHHPPLCDGLLQLYGVIIRTSRNKRRENYSRP